MAFSNEGYRQDPGPARRHYGIVQLLALLAIVAHSVPMDSEIPLFAWSPSAALATVVRCLDAPQSLQVDVFFASQLTPRVPA
jgi:hypothetical protein